MQKKFFIRRFIKYFLSLFIPTCLVFAVAFIVMNRQMDDALRQQGEMAVSSVNTNLELVVNNLVFQNEQFTNNSYMGLSLKKILRRSTDFSYSDAIYLRTIKAMLGSMIQTYPYVESVYLYLDGYENYYSSETGLTEVTGDSGDDWWENYSSKAAGKETVVIARDLGSYGQSHPVLTIYQKMLLLDGVVVMNIDVAKYRKLLDSTLNHPYGTVFYITEDQEVLFSWSETGAPADSFDIEDFQMNKRQNSWIRLGNEKYLAYTDFNDQYQLHLVSLISQEAKRVTLKQMGKLFAIIFAINTAAMFGLAYLTTKKNFYHLNHMIQVFHEAELGSYPTQQTVEIQDEYGVIMNNIVYLFLQTIKLDTDLKQKQYEQEAAQLTALQMQINPHFLFNTLQTVQLEVKKSGADTRYAEEVLENLSAILKYALADPMEPISLQEEISYLKKYVAIQKIRFGDRFIVYYEVEEGLEQLSVFHLMLQPLMENSILHGVRNKETRGYIKLQVFKRQSRICFRVVDNGIGMTKEACRALKESIQNPYVHHIGLANVNTRLKLYFGEDAQIHIRSKQGMGCVMEFYLPERGAEQKLR